jgi:hypothetical protein
MEQSPSADETAAIAAAVARFQVDTAPTETAAAEAANPWQRAALLEGVGAKGVVQKHLEGGSRWLS